MIHYKTFFNYLKIFLLAITSSLFLRVYETLAVLLLHNVYDAKFLLSQVYGLIKDFGFSIVILLVLFPVFRLFYRRNPSFAYSVYVFFIIFFGTIHFFILNYFLYALIPLDVFLYYYTLEEILFTVNTSGLNFFVPIIFLSSYILIITLLSVYLFRKKLSESFVKRIVKVVLSLLLAFFVMLFFFGSYLNNNFSKNKSLFFYYKSIELLVSKSPDYTVTKETVEQYHNIHHFNNYLSKDYPLLKEFNYKNVLGPYFDDFEQTPNIVILVVEGLSDDFVNNYKGMKLMPFLNDLKDNSLYWNNCKSMGERSFAVLPSLLGALPHSEIGFLFNERMPLHFSLVSILKSSNYKVNFFYGQGSWFHNKDSFFKYNYIDNIVDKDKFNKIYEKIIISRDGYFWGYNDKDLFNNSFDFLRDFSKDYPRMDIYFTGTSHSPFIFPEKDVYLSRLQEIRPNNVSNRYLDLNSKYLSSLMFVDDALKDFFNTYKDREDYSNSIFIITGDHPMTELEIENEIKKYNVPLIIYSPKLKKSQTFSEIVSHYDFYNTILAFLKEYDVKVPDFSSSLGGLLNTCKHKEDRILTFMTDNRQVHELYYNGYFLSNGKIYNVNDELAIKEDDNKDLKNKYLDKLKTIRSIDLYVNKKNKIIPFNKYVNFFRDNILYDTTFNDSISFRTDFFELLNKKDIPSGNGFYYYLEFEYNDIPDNTSLVVEITDKDGNNLLWENYGFKNQTYFQENIFLPPTEQKYINFKAYLWRQSASNVSFDFYNFKSFIIQF